MNIQLVAVNEDGNDVWLDLYEEQPIKLTFNIEDISTVKPKAEFSRQFRVPATDVNYNFFSTAFEINGVDFNPGIKYPARIVIDGADFRSGELRLLNIYRNDDLNRVDYEIAFIGATKGLINAIGNDGIGDLDWSAINHDLDETNIVNSWNAYPETANDAGALFSGDVLYPVVDFGNTYTGTTPNESRISPTGAHRFTQNSHPLVYNRFKPMIRARRVMQEIFDQAGYELTGNFFTDNDEVRKMYLTAWGDSDSIFVQPGNINFAKFGTTTAIDPAPVGGSSFVPFADTYYDYGSNIDAYNFALYGNSVQAYTAPTTGDYDITVYLPMKVRVYTDDGTNYNDDYQTTGLLYLGGPGVPANTPVLTIQVDPATGPCAGQGPQVIVNYVLFGQPPVIVTQTCIADNFTPEYLEYEFTVAFNVTNTITAGDYILPPAFSAPVGSAPEGSVELEILGNAYYEITDAPGAAYTPAQDFNTDYKQKDFILDMFNLFRLVMVPDPLNPTSLQVIPWNDYIGRGELKNWSTKLVTDKDIVIKPLLLDQPDKVTFTMAGDADEYNYENQEVFGEVFGTKKLDSVYDILEGEKEIKTKLAASPITQIYAYTTDWQDIFINQIHRLKTDGGFTIHEPIKPKPRLLYYAGLIPIGGTDVWYLQDTDGTNSTHSNIPQVSYWDQQQAPSGPNVKILNYEKEESWDTAGVVNELYGADLYTRFWSKYMELLYNKDSRRVTAYFALNADDILNFRYNDVIYCQGVYYYVEKIYDAPLGKDAVVKVDLITLKSYRPSVSIAPQPGNIVWENASSNWETGYTNNWENV